MSHEKLMIDGSAGPIEAILNHAQIATPRAIALVAHPHPLYGGNMDNKVAHTLAKAFVASGMVVLRWNFRGVGRSAGQYSEGRGEIEDVQPLAHWLKRRYPDLPLYAGGFSFGAFVMANAHLQNAFRRMVLIGTAVNHFSVPPVPSDTILIHGSVDTTVPLSDVLQWADPQSLIVHLMAGADHFFHQRLIPLRSLIVASLHDGCDSRMCR